MTAIHFIDGKWIEGNPPLMGPMDQAFWFATGVFDGARAFDGVAPDLDQHCARMLRSVGHFGLATELTVDDLIEVALDGCARFAAGTELYIRPYFYPQKGFLVAEPDSTRFVMTVYEEPIPEPNGSQVLLSSYRRPAPDTAPTMAKAACLYPMSGFAIKEAQDKGFDNAVMLDHENNVAEFATANLWIAKDGVAHTPAWNGSFLNGVTRQRVIKLLRETGIEVVERTISYDEVKAADEIFSTGNFAKVVPVTRIEDREIQPGPIYRQARDCYFEYARQSDIKVPKG